MESLKWDDDDNIYTQESCKSFEKDEDDTRGYAPVSLSDRQLLSKLWYQQGSGCRALLQEEADKIPSPQERLRVLRIFY